VRPASAASALEVHDGALHVDDRPRAGQLADPEDWDRTVKELGPLAKSDEDILLGVLFPMQAKDFLAQRGK